MRLVLVLALMLLAAAPAVTVVDRSGHAIPHAAVQQLSDGRVRVSAPGFVTRTLSLAPDVHTVVLDRVLPVIASVRVATGSVQTLHSLPVAASALDKSAIEANPAVTADGLLRQLPGFDRTRSNSMFSNYGLLRVSFAGSGNDRGLVLADGIPAQDGFGGQIDWAAYPPEDLQRAELLMGAGSALYGAGAVGGVLDLQTFAPPSDPDASPAGTLDFAAGSHAFSRQYADFSSWLAPRLSTSVTISQQRMQYDDLPPAYASPIDRVAQSDQSMAALRLRYAPDEHDSIGIGERGAWDDQFEGRPHYTFSRRLAQSDLTYAHTTPQSAVQTALYSRTAYIVNAADQFPAKPGVLRYVQDVPTNESGFSASWVAAGGPSTFELRADARHVRGESLQYGSGGAFQNSGSGAQNIGGIAAQESWRSGRAEIVAGARYDVLRSYAEQLAAAGKPQQSPPARSDAAVSPRLALRYDLSPALAVRASTGAGFRAPFLNELVRGYFIGSVAYQPNPLLVPERSRTDSAGLDLAAGAQRLSLDVFDTSVNDAIMFRTIDATHQMRSNVAATRTDGYTLSYTRGIGACSRLSAAYTDQYARVTAGPPAIVGKRLQYVPAQSASLSYTAQTGSVTTGLSVGYAGMTYADDLNNQPLGTALLVGASVRIPLPGGAALEIAGDNLTDARYLSSIDRYGPPSLITLGVSLPLGPGNNSQSGLRCIP